MAKDSKKAIKTADNTPEVANSALENDEDWAKKASEYLAKLQYLQADFENYKKYIDKHKSELAKTANKALIESILPLLDDLNSAAKHNEGTRLLRDKFVNVLKAHGLEKIDTSQKLNPLYHEAILQEKSEKDDGTILEEIRGGYMLNNLVIRAAQVKVAAKIDDNIMDKSEVKNNGE